MAKFARSFSAKHYVQSFLGRSWSTAIITRSSSTMVDTSDYSAVLPYEAIPGPKGTIRNVIDYAFSKGSFFDVLEKRYQKYGPIYSEQLMDLRVVSVFDVDAITKLLRIEKNFQMRPGFEAVAEIVEETGGTLGLASNDYNVWYPDRSLLSPKMLRPKDVNERYPILNTVSDDFVERVRLRSQTGGTMKNIEEELSYWTVESFAGFLFNQRLGFYNNPPDPEAIKFVDAARTMLEGTGKFLHGSPFYKYIKTPTYYAFKRSLLDIHVSGGQLVSKVMDSIKESSQKKTGREQSLFEWLAENDEVNSHKRMTSMLVGLMSAGIDSTSTTVLWLLYALSRDSRVQEKLYYELLTSFGAEGYVSASKIPSYLRSAVRESQRLYPVAGYVVPRVFDKDIEVLGYSIPAGTKIFSYEFLNVIDERYYGEDAKQFVPERWMRDDEGAKRELNAFTMLPFGFGVRMCIGRRMAEALIYTITSKVLLKYRIEYAGGAEVGKSLVGPFMGPDRPVLLRFIPR